MKNTAKKFLSVMLAVLVVIACASLLFACNKDKDKERAERDARERAQSVAVVKNSILGAIDSDWKGEMDNDSLAELDNAGDYVVAAGWADLICDVFKSSALQTGKLTSLKNAVISEDGKKLLADFTENAELLIPLMRVADFTPTDISNLAYDLLCALVADSEKAVNLMNARINGLLNMSGLSSATVANLRKCGLELAVVKNDYVPTSQEKQEMLAAFAASKAPLGEITAFVYNMSIGSITDNIFDALFNSDGALENITDGEINTIIQTLINNASQLKEALDDTAILNINKSISLIIAKFDKNNVSSALYGEIVRYAKYANSVVDVIPAMCDFLGSVGKLFEDTELISQLRAVAGADINDNTKLINYSIIAGKIAEQVRKDFTAQELSDIIQKIGLKLGDEYQKTVPIFALDMSLNLSTWLKDAEMTEIAGKHPDILTEEDIKVVLGVFLLTSGLDNAKQTYRDYQNGTASAYQLMSAVNLCGFDNFGIENPYSPHVSGQLEVWYNYLMVEGVKQANEKAVAVASKAISDIKVFIEDYYKSDSESRAIIGEIADWQLLTSSLTDEKYKEYEEQILKSDLLGIVGLISMIFT